MKQLVQCFHRKACDPKVFWLNGHLWVKEKKNPKLQKKKKKRKTLYTNIKQNKNHTEIEKLPKCITNKILFEEKRAWIQSIHKWLTWN